MAGMQGDNLLLLVRLEERQVTAATLEAVIQTLDTAMNTLQGA